MDGRKLSDVLPEVPEVYDENEIRKKWRWEEGEDGKGYGSCRSCGETVFWIKSPKGKNMPLSVKTTVMWGGDLYATCHFGDCPNADQHRGGGGGIADKVERAFGAKSPEEIRLRQWLTWRSQWTGAPAPVDKDGTIWFKCALRGDKAPAVKEPEPFPENATPF